MSDDAPEIIDTDDDEQETTSEVDNGPAVKVVKLFVIFLLSWKVVCSISDTALALILKFLVESFKNF